VWRKALGLIVFSLVLAGCGARSARHVGSLGEPGLVPPELVLVGRVHSGSPPLSQRELAQWRKRFQWPVEGGIVSSRFGRRNGRFHDGIDIQAPAGTPVRAAWDGEVIFTGSLRGYGQTVAIRHGRDVLTLYAHLRRSHVRAGQRVRAGTVIGTVGSSGRASGPNLHFEIRRARVAWNPESFVGPRLLAEKSRRRGSGS
jgi:murein DD-endopeptidase MepM/ murein hydrolase activator NlpD